MKNKHTSYILPGAIYTFKIGGKSALPKGMPKDTRELIHPEWKIDKDKVANGENLCY